MALRHLRVCAACNKEENTFSRTSICASCTTTVKGKASAEAERLHLIELGYRVVGDSILTKHGHRQWTLIPSCCGTEFSPTYGNVIKQLNSHGKPPCLACGGKERMSKAIAGYVEKYGASYNLKEFREYQLKVRRLTGRNYEAWKHIINPLDLPRGRQIGMWHLDHKVPIIWCFKNNIAAEIAASPQNLQMLQAIKNLQKSGKLLNDDEAASILRESAVSGNFFAKTGEHLRAEVEIVADTANIWSSEKKLVLRESEVLGNFAAVQSRIDYKLGLTPIKIGARKLKVLPVTSAGAKSFLDMWHVQGNTPAKILLGLWDEEELCAVMTFGPPRYKQTSATWELIRFCSRGDMVVMGGASKLFNAFIKQQLPTQVVSYSLNRWGSGAVYETLGFKKKGSVSSAKYLWRDDNKLRSWRASILRARKYGNVCSGGEITGTLKVQDMGSTTWMWLNGT